MRSDSSPAAESPDAACVYCGGVENRQKTTGKICHKYTHLPLYGLTREQLEYMAGAVLGAVRERREGK